MSPFVFEGEIKMSSSRSFEIGNFTFDPDIGQLPLQHFADLETEFGNGIDASLKLGITHAGEYILTFIKWLKRFTG